MFLIYPKTVLPKPSTQNKSTRNFLTPRKSQIVNFKPQHLPDTYIPEYPLPPGLVTPPLIVCRLDSQNNSYNATLHNVQSLNNTLINNYHTYFVFSGKFRSCLRHAHFKLPYKACFVMGSIKIAGE